MPSLLIPFGIAILSLIIIMKSAELAITAISGYARKTGISDYLIGFLVVSIGTSLPDLTIAIMGSLLNNGKLVLGELIGANIIDMTLVLGLAAVIGKVIKVEGKLLDKNILSVAILTALPVILAIDGELSRIDGVILLSGFLVYLYRLIQKERSAGKIKKDIKWKLIYREMIIFLSSLIALLLSTRWFLISTLQISDYFNIPKFMMGLIFVAFGTTISDITVLLKSLVKGHSSIGFGNVLGSVVINISLILGLAAVIRPIRFDARPVIGTLLFMLTGVVVGILFLKKKKVTWQEGVALLLIYITFIVYEGIAI